MLGGYIMVATSTGTANDLARSKASSHENLSLHLSSKLLWSSEVGLLLGLLLLDFGEPSERFFFPVGIDSTEDGLSECNRPNRVISKGSTRVVVALLVVSVAVFCCSSRFFLDL